jgi:hypothetical protein
MHLIKNAMSIDRPIYSVMVIPKNKHQRIRHKQIVRRVRGNYNNPYDPYNRNYKSCNNCEQNKNKK